MGECLGLGPTSYGAAGWPLGRGVGRLEVWRAPMYYGSASGKHLLVDGSIMSGDDPGSPRLICGDR